MACRNSQGPIVKDTEKSETRFEIVAYGRTKRGPEV